MKQFVLRFGFIYSVLFLFMLFQVVYSQSLDMDKLKGITPRSIGPAGMSGRVTAIDVVNKNKNIIYVGTASGGLWKSDNGGYAWKPLTDKENIASIGSIDIYQENPNIIWIGIGEGNPRNSQTSGAGVYRSLDGGETWQHKGLDDAYNIHRIVIHPTNSDIIYAGVQGTAWGESESRGVYRSLDGGETWQKILYINQKTGIADMVMDPQNPNKLMVAMWEYRRWPWFFESGGEGSGIHVTYDGGETWKQVESEDGIPEGQLGRVGLAIAPSNPNVVYAWIESKKNALYRSLDGGKTWHIRSTMKKDPNVGNRPFYYAEIYVDPIDENRIYSLWSHISYSIDGGKTFQRMFPYYNYVHPDHHAWWIDPDNPDYLIDGNDGGLAISRNRGKTWYFIETLPVGQFYHINVDMSIPYHVYGGMQDNGSWKGPAYVWRAGGVRNSYWEEILFGDGFDVAIDKSHQGYAYAMSQGGNVARINTKTGGVRFIKPLHPDGKPLRFNWNAAIAVDPFEDKTIYFGSQYVHKSTDRGETWTIISEDLTTNDSEKQKQVESGGLTVDATGAENFTSILAITPSPQKQGVIWVGTDDGNIYVTQDDGSNWQNVTRGLRNVPKGSWVAQIKASPHNPAEAFAVINNYRRNDWKPYLMHTTNYGKKWNNIAAKKDFMGYVLSFVQDPIEPKLMFAGTEFGLYMSIDGGKRWERWTHKYPTVSTYDMVIHPREHDLVIGTFGRSIYIIDDIRPLRMLAKEGMNTVFNKTIHAVTPPDAYLVFSRRAAGTRFAAEGIFSGDNREIGAMLSFFVTQPEDSKDMSKEEEKAENETSKNDKVTIEIYDKENYRIRTLKVEPEYDGLNRIVWGLDRKGVRYPGTPKPKPNAKEPSGSSVLPGEYKVRYVYRDAVDSTYIRVKLDPRITINSQHLSQIKKQVKQWEAYVSKTTQMVDMLKDMKDIISHVNKWIELDNRDDVSDFNTIKDKGKELDKMIDEYLELILPKEDAKQGINRFPNILNAKLNTARYYIQTAYEGTSDSGQQALYHIQKQLQDIINKVNTFIGTEWQSYQMEVEANPSNPFPTYKPITLDK